MTWAVKFGEVHTQAPAMAAKMAGPMPVIPAGCELYVTAFHNMQTERPVADGVVVALPFSKIVWLSDFYDVSDVLTFVEIIQAMDGEFVKRINEIRSRKENIARAKPKK